jgi:tRNA uridine 5-carboxymethylaminomethyl modification enzyme
VDGKTLWTHLQRPGATLESLLPAGGRGSSELRELDALRRDQPSAVRTACIDAQYAGYLAKQDRALRHLRDLDAKRIPEEFDYAEISHLRHEAREKLSAVRPVSLGQALRVSGITPADVTILSIHLARRRSARGPQVGEKDAEGDVG